MSVLRINSCQKLILKKCLRLLEKIDKVNIKMYNIYEFSRKAPSVPSSPKDAECRVHDT